MVAVSTRNAVDASELHPFEFWSWTKIRIGFIALFIAAFVALLAATIAIIVKEAGRWGGSVDQNLCIKCGVSGVLGLLSHGLP